MRLHKRAFHNEPEHTEQPGKMILSVGCEAGMTEQMDFIDVLKALVSRKTARIVLGSKRTKMEPL